MTDKIWIISAGDLQFDTRPSGSLYVAEDGTVKLDKVKTFNRARRILNAGANAFAVLRYGSTTWFPPAAVEFDWQSPGYFDLLREFVEIIHQPTQDSTTSNQGADVIIDLFIGCCEQWQYDPANWNKARELIRKMLSALSNLSYVRFSMGRECNSEYARTFAREVVFPEFKAAGIKPFYTGAIYQRMNPPGSPGPLEWENYEIEAAWDEDTKLHTYRKVHGVKDDNSPTLLDTTRFWTVNSNPISVIWSVDGVWDGESETDRITKADGTVQARPSASQLKSAMRYWIANAPRLTMPDGTAKYGFEYMSKCLDADVAANQIRVISEVYAETWGVLSSNYGQYPDDWVEPQPEPEPEPPQPTPLPFNIWGWLNNRKWYFLGLAVIISIIWVFNKC